MWFVAALTIVAGSLIVLMILFEYPGGIPPSYMATDHDIRLTLIAREAVPIIQSIDRYYKAHGQCPRVSADDLAELQNGIGDSVIATIIAGEIDFQMSGAVTGWMYYWRGRGGSIYQKPVASATKTGIVGIMVDLFACRKCHAVYALTRHQQPSNVAPFCKVCGNEFPPKELGEWLTYERADPEETVNQWLTSAPTAPETSVTPPSSRLRLLAGRVRTEIMPRNVARTSGPLRSDEELKLPGSRDRPASS